MRTPFLDYDEFVEKFKPKKTTDDCYTPAAVFEAVKTWVFAEFKLPAETQIVRPFYPGKDFESEEYPAGCVVLDNPPFSLISKIVSFFCGNGVRFFLFAPGLAMTGLARLPEITLIPGIQLTFENGAKVLTGFVTNLCNGRFRVIADPALCDALVRANALPRKKPRPVYEFDANLITVKDLVRVARRGVEWRLAAVDAHFVRGLDGMRVVGSKASPFGNGAFLISDSARDELARAEKKAAEKEKTGTGTGTAAPEQIPIRLSAVEREIVRRLNRHNFDDTGTAAAA